MTAIISCSLPGFVSPNTADFQSQYRDQTSLDAQGCCFVRASVTETTYLIKNLEHVLRSRSLSIRPQRTAILRREWTFGRPHRRIRPLNSSQQKESRLERSK